MSVCVQQRPESPAVGRRAGGGRPRSLARNRVRATHGTVCAGRVATDRHRSQPMPGYQMVVVAVCCALVVIGLGLLGSARAGAGAPSEPGADQGSTTQVRAGEDLWDVARRVVPGIAPAAVVHRIRTINRLDPGPVWQGEPLRVPVVPGQR